MFTGSKHSYTPKNTVKRAVFFFLLVARPARTLPNSGSIQERHDTGREQSGANASDVEYARFPSFSVSCANRHWPWDALSSVQLVPLTIKSFFLRPVTACEKSRKCLTESLCYQCFSASSSSNSNPSCRVFARRWQTQLETQFSKHN